MSDKKYDAKQAARMVLEKAHSMLKEQQLKKKHEHIGWNKLEDKLRGEGYSKESQDKIAGSIKAKLNKDEPEYPGNEPEEGKVNLKPEESEWGQEPGVFKLAHFCGKMEEKRKHKSEPESKEQESEKTPEETVVK